MNKRIAGVVLLLLATAVVPAFAQSTTSPEVTSGPEPTTEVSIESSTPTVADDFVAEDDDDGGAGNVVLPLLIGTVAALAVAGGMAARASARGRRAPPRR